MDRLIAFSSCHWPDILLKGVALPPRNTLPERVRDLRIRSCSGSALDLGGIEQVFNLLEINDCQELEEIFCRPEYLRPEHLRENPTEYLWILNCPRLERIHSWGQAAKIICIANCPKLFSIPPFPPSTQFVKLHQTGLHTLPPFSSPSSPPHIELSSNPNLLFSSPPETLKEDWTIFWQTRDAIRALKQPIIAAAMHPFRVAKYMEMTADDLDAALAAFE